MIDSKTRMKVFLRTVLILATIGLVVIVGIYLFFGIAFGTFDKDYSLSELKDNFNTKRKEIYEAKNYFYCILPKNTEVSIEFENDKELCYFDIEKGSAYYSLTNKNIQSKNTDSLLTILGWTRKNLSELKAKLDKANCISFDLRDKFKIGFQRSGMGKYYFQLLDKPMNDSIKSTINQDCVYIHNDSVIFDYGGGALNQDCLYNH